MLELREKRSDDLATWLGIGLGLLPWQRFVLAVLLFLDVALIGGLFLVVLGCISL
ncbi:MAG: hypothetical protein K8R89_04700 [Anaerolineae bacterium]|nr:hypothetical protein [Anaerolineae bacterium]